MMRRLLPLLGVYQLTDAEYHADPDAHAGH